MSKLVPILSCSYFHVCMLRCDQTHTNQEIMFKFYLSIILHPSLKNTYDNSNTFFSDKPPL